MIKFKSKGADGKTHTLNFPETLTELSYNAKTAFDVYREDLALWVANEIESETFGENRNWYLYLACKCVSEFLDTDINKLMGFEVELDDGGMLSLPVLAEHFKDLKELKQFDITKDQENIILNLYGNACGLVDRYKFEFKNPANYTFKHGGKEYEVPYLLKTTIFGKKQFSKVEVIKIVEATKVRQQLDKLTFKDLDKSKNARFSANMKIIATTVKQKGKPVPLDDVPFLVGVDQRVEELQNIDAKTGMDICFFLTSTILN